jgi:CHAT domain-containing protein
MTKMRLKRKLLYRFFWGLVTLCLWLGYGWTVGVSAVVGSEDSLFHQGLQHYQSGDFQGAIQIWQADLAATPGTTSASPIATLKGLVRAHQQLGQLPPAIAYLERLQAAYQHPGDRQPLGRILTEMAQLYSALGQQARAIALLCDAPVGPNPADLSSDMPFGVSSGVSSGGLGSCAPGSAVAIAQSTQDLPGQAAAWGALGNIYRVQGRYGAALQGLTQSLALATTAQRTSTTIAALQGLGHTYSNLAAQDYRYAQFARQVQDAQAQRLHQDARRYDQLAIEHFERSLRLADSQPDGVDAVRARLNLIPLYHRNAIAIAPVLQQVQDRLPTLPASDAKVAVLLRLASFTQLIPDPDAEWAGTIRCPDQRPMQPTLDWLSQAHDLAQQIRNPVAIALTLGRLGHFYECQQDYAVALQWTQQAQLAGQGQDGRYLWHWQAARIFKAQGQVQESLAAYEMAVNMLKGIRNGLAIAGRDVQFDFRDSVESIYRELADLQLTQATTLSSPVVRYPSVQRVAAVLSARSADVGAFDGGSSSEDPRAAGSALVAAALETIDNLHLAELQNYLGDDCTLDPIAKPIALLDQKTAVLSSILLGDRTALILTRPDGPAHARSQVHWLSVAPSDLTRTVNTLRQQLEKRSDLMNSYRQPAQQLYDWLIRPFAAELDQIETLVFVQDGILRSIPMAALYDGQQFLMERYAIANTLSLTLIDPTQMDRQNLRVVAFGLTQPALIEGDLAFDGLQDVSAEIQQIMATMPGSTGLLDREFTRDRLQRELQQANTPIIHLATHGKFGMDSRDTFLVTGKRAPLTAATAPPARLYNEKLTMNQLYAMIRQRPRGNPVELLTLTACETAVGSDRDALGIAGIALQAGARSAIASLWQVDDQATAALITDFYQGLRQGLSRAKALQQAQKLWLQRHPGSHPSYWAALILVGNWL